MYFASNCSFVRVYLVKTLFQVFRCHKNILALCSEAFEKLLFGRFKEATADRDYEIVLDKTSPYVFELAMRL